MALSSILSSQISVVIQGEYTLVPEAHTVWNQFDEHGSLVSLKRLKAEDNTSYRRRIMDVFTHQASSSYRGLVNGITRELGLSFFYPLQINPKIKSDGAFLAPDPYIKFDGAYLFLYSNYRNNILEFKIDRYEPGGNYEHLTRLVDAINNTTYFEATLLSGIENAYTKSMTILNQSNRDIMLIEDVQCSTKFNLKHSHVVPGTFLNNNQAYFSREVNSEASIARHGDYWIDYTKGLVSMYDIPDEGTAVRYEYITYPFKPIASEVILYNINDDNFKTKLFSQILSDDGSYINGLPTELGVEIINELISVVPMYWGV